VLQLLLDRFVPVDFFEEVSFVAVLDDMVQHSVYFTQFFSKLVRHVFDVIVKLHLRRFLQLLSLLGWSKAVFQTLFGLFEL